MALSLLQHSRRALTRSAQALAARGAAFPLQPSAAASCDSPLTAPSGAQVLAGLHAAQQPLRSTPLHPSLGRSPSAASATSFLSPAALASATPTTSSQQAATQSNELRGPANEIRGPGVLDRVWGLLFPQESAGGDPLPPPSTGKRGSAKAGPKALARGASPGSPGRGSLLDLLLHDSLARAVPAPRRRAPASPGPGKAPVKDEELAGVWGSMTLSEKLQRLEGWVGREVLLQQAPTTTSSSSSRSSRGQSLRTMPDLVARVDALMVGLQDAAFVRELLHADPKVLVKRAAHFETYLAKAKLFQDLHFSAKDIFGSTGWKVALRTSAEKLRERVVSVRRKGFVIGLQGRCPGSYNVSTLVKMSEANFRAKFVSA